MTHLFEVNENEMRQLVLGHKKFDILKFNRSVSVGDTILYQLGQVVRGEDDEISDVQTEEHSVKIDYLFGDAEGALKKGYCAVGFKENGIHD